MSALVPRASLEAAQGLAHQQRLVESVDAELRWSWKHHRDGGGCAGERRQGRDPPRPHVQISIFWVLGLDHVSAVMVTELLLGVWPY